MHLRDFPTLLISNFLFMSLSFHSNHLTRRRVSEWERWRYGRSFIKALNKSSSESTFENERVRGADSVGNEGWYRSQFLYCTEICSEKSLKCCISALSSVKESNIWKLILIILGELWKSFLRISMRFSTIIYVAVRTMNNARSKMLTFIS